MNNTMSIRRLVTLVCAATALCLAAASSAAAIAITDFSSIATQADGTLETRAGAHPHQVVTSIGFNTTLDDNGNPKPAENLKSLRVDLPRGLIGDPTVVPACNQEALEALFTGGCPLDTQVGVVKLVQALGGPDTTTFYFPLYRVSARSTAPAEFGFNALVATIRSKAEVRTGEDYGLAFSLRDIPQPISIVSTEITLWGVPADPSHNPERGATCTDTPIGHLCPIRPGGGPSSLTPRPFLTMPSDCASGAMVTRAVATSWQDATPATATWQSQQNDGTPAGIEGCDQLRFPASFSAKPADAEAGAPAPYMMDLDIAQNDNPTGRGTPPLKKAVVTLPEGTTISPSAATGLGACSPAEIALDSAAADTCPASSRIGDVSLETPLLDHPMSGSIYLAKPHDNPSGSLMAIYLVIEGSGTRIKLPGAIALDEKTGRITATFDNNPQLPFTNLHLAFRGGDRAPLANPMSCGTKTTTAELTSWAGQVSESTSSFEISGDGQGGACPAPKFGPKLEEGVTNPTAGASSPFTFRLTREDADDEFSTVRTTLPAGMLANVKDIALCGDAQAAAGTCGDDSKIGHVEVGSGSGGSPFFLQGGRVNFTGPYRGAPFGLSIAVPVLAGPFDLGTVVVRAAVSVDPATAAVTVDTDPLPTMLQGIPLKMRELRLTIDRPGFMINPTSCDERTLGATIGSTAGATSTVGNRFQVANCASLPLAPKLSLGLGGATKSGGNPTLTAHLTQQRGESNLRQAVVKLPTAVGFNIKNNKAVCKAVDAAAGHCPDASIVGQASVRSVLHEALTGPVHLIEGNAVDAKTGKGITGLPGLFIPLKGEGVTLNLRAATSIVKGRLVETFENIPDAPIESFDLSVAGGTGSILVYAKDVCKVNPAAVIQADGQNGKIADGTIVATTPCTLRKLSHKVSTKSVSLRLGGLGAGKVTVKGASVRTTTRKIGSAAVATVTAPLTAKAWGLARKHELRKVRVQVRFEPAAGKAVSRTYSIPVG